MQKSSKDRLLDAAEALFAQRGFAGASLREITRAANVELGLANYHFGSKDELFRQVIRRRAPEICSSLLTALDSPDDAAERHGRPSIGHIVSAYVSTHLLRIANGDQGWLNYVKLVCHAAILGERRDLTKPLEEEYQEVRKRYREAFRAALPDAPRQQIDHAFYLLRHSVASICADAGMRAAATPDRPILDYAVLSASLSTFLTAGFEGLSLAR